MQAVLASYGMGMKKRKNMIEMSTAMRSDIDPRNCKNLDQRTN